MFQLRRKVMEAIFLYDRGSDWISHGPVVTNLLLGGSEASTRGNAPLSERCSATQQWGGYTELSAWNKIIHFGRNVSNDLFASC